MYHKTDYYVNATISISSDPRSPLDTAFTIEPYIVIYK